jgi:hypothetical protein
MPDYYRVGDVSGPLRLRSGQPATRNRAASGRAFVPETRGAGHLKKLAT